MNNNVRPEFILKIQLSNGKKEYFLLPKDLTIPLFHEPKYMNDLKNSLINIPLAPYTEKNHRKPPIDTGRILRIYASENTRWINSIRLRTRSQFYDFNKNDTINGINYLKHDYSKLDKLNIASDINSLLSNKNKSFLINWITNIRIKHNN